MTPIYEILKHIRVQKKYNANAIASLLNVSSRAFHKYETSFQHLSDTFLKAWMLTLDLPPEDLAWYSQMHKRETAFIKLQEDFPNEPEGVLQNIADFLTFRKEINNHPIRLAIIQEIIPIIHFRPRSAENAIYELTRPDEQ